MKVFSKLKYLLLGGIFLFAGSVEAVNVTVPSAPGPGYGLISTTTGAYIATSTGVVTCTGSASCNTGSYVFGNALIITGATAAGYPFTPSTFGTLSVSATSTAIVDYAGLVTATSTIGVLTASSSITNQSVRSALVLNSATGLEGAYAGTATCNPGQGVFSISATGVATCATFGSTSFSTTSADYWITSTTSLPQLAAVNKTLTGNLQINSGVLYTTATGTLSGSGLVSVANGVNLGGAGTVSLSNISANTVIGNNTGASGAPVAFATTSLFAGTPGQVLSFQNGVWSGVATNTLTNGTGISTAFAANTWTITNTGVTSIVAGTGIAVSGATGAVTVTNTTGYPFTPSTFGVAVQATTSILYPAGLVTGTSTIGSLTASSTFSGAGLSTCNGASQAVTWATGLFGCNTIVSASFSTTSADYWITATTSLPQLAAVNKNLTGNLQINGGVLYTVATSTATCSGGIACNTFTVLGTVNPSFTNLIGYPFVPTSNFGTTTSATSTGIWAQMGVYASSTSQFMNLFAGNLFASSTASSTTLVISGTPNCSGSNALQTSASGLVSCGAVSGSGGSGYPFIPDINFGTSTSATSTAIWDKVGLFASSTSRFNIAAFSSTTQPQILLTDNSTGFAFRAVNGSLIIATTTGESFATTTMSSIFTATRSGKFAMGLGAPTNPTSTLMLYEQEGVGASPSLMFGGNVGGDTDFCIHRNTNNNSADDDSFMFGTTSTISGQLNCGAINAGITMLRTGFTGIGTTTPWKTLSVGTGNIGSFAISSTTAGIACFSPLGELYSGSCGSVAVDFTYSSNFATIMAATTSPIWAQRGIYASTTAQLTDAVLASSTGGQLFLSDKGTGPNYAFRNINGNFYLSTTSILAPLSTTTGPIMTIATSGNLGIGTTTPFARLSVDTSAVPLNAPLFSIGSSTRQDVLINQQGSVRLGTTSAVNTSAGGCFGERLCIDSGVASTFAGIAFSQATAAGYIDIFSSGAGAGFEYVTPGNFGHTFFTNNLGRMTITGQGFMGIGTSTPRWPLQIASSTQPQLTLSDGSATSPHISFRNMNGNFWIASSSPTGMATSSFPLLTILASNGYWGIGTTSPWSRLTLDRFSTDTAYASSSITVTEYQIATTTNKTIDWRDSNNQLFKIGSSATTITFTGFVAGMQMKLMVCNPGAAAGALTWGTQIMWSGGTAPTQTTTLNKCDLYSFFASNATGTTVRIFGGQNTF